MKDGLGGQEKFVDSRARYQLHTAIRASHYLPPCLLTLAYSNNFSSYGNGGGGTDFMEESRQALTPALEAYEEMLSILRLSK